MTIFQKVDAIYDRMKEVERQTSTLIYSNGYLCTLRTKNAGIRLRWH